MTCSWFCWHVCNVWSANDTPLALNVWSANDTPLALLEEPLNFNSGLLLLLLLLLPGTEHNYERRVNPLPQTYWIDFLSFCPWKSEFTKLGASQEKWKNETKLVSLGRGEGVLNWQWWNFKSNPRMLLMDVQETRSSNIHKQLSDW